MSFKKIISIEKTLIGSLRVEIANKWHPSVGKIIHHKFLSYTVEEQWFFGR